MSVESEVKSLIMTSVWNTMVKDGESVGLRLPHGDFSDEFMEKVADEVYEVIWEYVKDYD